MTPPVALHIKVYCAWPTATLRTSFVKSRLSVASALVPVMMNSPMWEMSNKPTCCRTARCSARIPAYCTGISQPPNGTIFAPSATCAACKGVCWSDIALPPYRCRLALSRILNRVSWMDVVVVRPHGGNQFDGVGQCDCARWFFAQILDCRGGRMACQF